LPPPPIGAFPFADSARFAFAEKSQLLKKLPCRKTATSTGFTAPNLKPIDKKKPDST